MKIHFLPLLLSSLLLSNLAYANEKKDPLDMFKCSSSTVEARGVQVCIKDGKFNFYDSNMFGKENSFSSTFKEYLNASPSLKSKIEITGSLGSYSKEWEVSPGYWEVVNMAKSNNDVGLLSLPDGSSFQIENENEISLALLVPNENSDNVNIVFYMNNIVKPENFTLSCSKKNQKCDAIINKDESLVSFEINKNFTLNQPLVVEQDGIILKIEFSKLDSNEKK